MSRQHHILIYAQAQLVEKISRLDDFMLSTVLLKNLLSQRHSDAPTSHYLGSTHPFRRWKGFNLHPYEEERGIASSGEIILSITSTESFCRLLTALRCSTVAIFCLNVRICLAASSFWTAFHSRRVGRLLRSVLSV